MYDNNMTCADGNSNVMRTTNIKFCIRDTVLYYESNGLGISLNLKLNGVEKQN